MIGLVVSRDVWSDRVHAGDAFVGVPVGSHRERRLDRLDRVPIGLFSYETLLGRLCFRLGLIELAQQG